MAAQNDYKSQAYAPSVQQQKQNYDQQQQFIQQMQQQAAGQGPSLAGQLLQNSVQQQTAQANALAASQQGNINPGLATRNAQQMAGQAGQAAAGQAAAMRQGEQLQAQQMLGNQINTTGQMGAQQQQFSDQLNAGIAQKNVESQNSLINTVTGGLIGAAGGIGAAAVKSDERSKKDIQPAGNDIKQFLDALSAHSYQYKDPTEPGTSPGEHTGVMAQELEKSKVGSQMVTNTPTGKMVDYAKGLPAILAAQAELNKRLDKIEGKGSKRMAEGGEVPEEGYKTPDAKTMAGGALEGFSKGMASVKETPSSPMGSPAFMSVDAPVVRAMPPVAPMEAPVMGSSFAAQTLQKMARGGMAKPALTTPQILMQHGAVVPGKAKVSGDSPKNDIVDAKLSPGEIVIPRTVVNSKDAPEAAKRFVEAILAKKGKK